MMKVFRFNDLAPVMWKNGGGVTREIARREDDGEFVWRLSIADVASEGPFSAFPGLQRILTVIEGEGMVLQRPGRDAIVASRFDPVAFSGDEAINGVLPNGPCRDFNVIWNPALATASVTLVNMQHSISDAETDGSVGVLCLSGLLQLSTDRALAPLDFAFLDARGDRGQLADDSSALLIRITPISEL